MGQRGLSQVLGQRFVKLKLDRQWPLALEACGHAARIVAELERLGALGICIKHAGALDTVQR
ncbi:hypothetical protein D3C72_1915100 [compost metagenome]